MALVTSHPRWTFLYVCSIHYRNKALTKQCVRERYFRGVQIADSGHTQGDSRQFYRGVVFVNNPFKVDQSCRLTVK